MKNLPPEKPIFEVLRIKSILRLFTRVFVLAYRNFNNHPLPLWGWTTSASGGCRAFVGHNMRVRVRGILSFVAIFLIFISVIKGHSENEKTYRNLKAFYSYDFKKHKTVAEAVRKLKQSGINAVFADCKNKELIKALRRNNIHIFVEVSIFAGADYWKKHPETRPVNANGEKISKIKWYAGLCPNQEWMRREKLRYIEKLITTYEIDGIWLDFIRYPCHWEVPEPKPEETCFCNECLKIFQNETKIKIPSDFTSTKDKSDWILKNHRKEWTNWKCSRITSFIKSAREIIDKNKPNVMLGIFSVPWKPSDYANAIERIISQDYSKLSEYVDVLSPMIYHRMCKRPVEWIGEFTDYAFKTTGKSIVPIVQTNDIDDKEFAKMIQSLAKSKSDGFILFGSDNLYKKQILEVLK